MYLLMGDVSEKAYNAIAISRIIITKCISSIFVWTNTVTYLVWSFRRVEPACEHVEGGRYVGPEFQLGQVYDGGPSTTVDDVVLYRPVYVCVSTLRNHLKGGNNFAANCAKLTQQNSREKNNPAMTGAITAISAATTASSATTTSTAAAAAKSPVMATSSATPSVTISSSQQQQQNPSWLDRHVWCSFRYIAHSLTIKTVRKLYKALLPLSRLPHGALVFPCSLGALLNENQARKGTISTLGNSCASWNDSFVFHRLLLLHSSELVFFSYLDHTLPILMP